MNNLNIDVVIVREFPIVALSSPKAKEWFEAMKE